MHVKNIKQFPIEIIKPQSLQRKLNTFTTCELTENEVELFNKVLKCIDNHLIIDEIDLSTLYTLNVFFIEEEVSFSYEGNTGTLGNQFHLATYRMSKLRNYNSDVLVALTFAEELVHYYWKIFNETTVKHKIVEILNDIYPQLTIDMLKKLGMNGL